jgi:ClpP class serine protease
MSPKNPAAVELGRKGGKATARNRTAEERAEAARKAVEARWAKQRKLVDEISERTKQLLKASKAANARAKRATQKQTNP